MRLVISAAIVLFCACARTIPPPPCTLPTDLVIRWGTWFDTLGVIRGYQLQWSGIVSSYEQNIRTGDIHVLDTLTISIERKTHCDVATDLRNAFVQNQAYVVIGPVSHFVELSTSSTTARAVWDARYETYGSRHFRAIFRWLNHLIGRHETADR
jgi:hypothetical protein